ncbi:hypothetical protein [Methylibium sp. T29-B]|uniref:hypothetical protein n=1 Tax=Methylibium sp. T29-B TaxID=1437443 RepID=UPI0018CC2C05|nr:hypothetical protein [Methylibium sp. T29-B]
MLGLPEGTDVLVVTTYAQRHWDVYAKRCVETFEQFWDTPLAAYTDELLEDESSWLSDFKARHAHRPTDNYRFDAVRFAHKVAAIELAYELADDILIWMDADCVTHAPVTKEWLRSLIGDADFAYLKREGKYPECGFMMFRKGACDRFNAEIVDLYKTDKLFDLAEWHDSWAIEEVRKTAGLKCVSLSGDAERTGHPLVNGPLGEKLDHLKGKRKDRGKSLPSDMKIKRAEAYWSR